jgi:hypothetical protein
MANYINLTERKEFSGREITDAKIGKFIRIIRNGEKTLVPVSQVKINNHSIYRLADAENVIKIYPGNGVAMTKDEYNNIMSHGQKIIDDMFGDLLKKTENIK